MAENYKVSVIVPVYKVENYLDKCLQSICSQSYKNLEIIVVDDGSPDECPQMCEKWAGRDSRIKVVHKKNGGLGSARNAGLDIATGDLVGFVDSDDWCEKTMFLRLVECYERTKASIVVCDVFVDWENGWSTEAKCFGNKDLYSHDELLRAFFQGEIECWMWNKLYTRNLWEGLRFKNQLYEDIPVLRQMTQSALSIAFTHSAEYHYVQRQGSIVNTKINERHFVLLDEMKANAELAKKCAPECVEFCSKSIAEVAYSLLYRAVNQNQFLDKYEEWVDLIVQNKDFIQLTQVYGRVDLFVMNRIAARKRYRTMLRILYNLKKIYFIFKSLRTAQRK